MLFKLCSALFCDFYNPDGECEWHYQPCGKPCMKTCKNPSAACYNNIPALEGKNDMDVILHTFLRVNHALCFIANPIG